MKIILKSLSKWKLMLYVLFAVLYSLQGLLLSFIIQFAGEINPRDKGALLVFGIGGIALFVLIYACMYIDNLLVRSIIKEFNILISGRTLTYFHLKKIRVYRGGVKLIFNTGYSDVLARIFDSYAHLSSIWLIHSSIYSLSHHAEFFYRLSLYNRWLLDDHSSVCI